MQQWSRAALTSAVALAFALTPSVSAAQTVMPAAFATAPAGVVPALSASDSIRRSALMTRRDGFIAAGFVVSTLALVPLDSRIEHALQEPRTQASYRTQRAARTFNWIGGVGAPLITVTLYGVGRLGHQEHLADVGLHATEALVLSAGVATVIKELAGRARPSVAGDDPDRFTFGHGTYSSLPSGHTTATFAAVTVATLETARVWPRSTWYVAPLLYGGATMVGFARLYTNTHWATDVALGAGIGTLTGLAVVRFQHTHPHNRLDRWLLGTATSATVLPDGHGRVAVGWSMGPHD